LKKLYENNWIESSIKKWETNLVAGWVDAEIPIMGKYASF